MADRLKKLLYIRQTQERQSRQALAQAQDRTDQARQQLDELQDIAQDYRDGHARTPQMTPGMLQQFRQFYGQLAKARAVQADQVGQAEAAQQTVQRHLLGHIQNRRSLEKVVAKRDQDLVMTQNRKQRRAQSGSRKSLV